MQTGAIFCYTDFVNDVKELPDGTVSVALDEEILDKIREIVWSDTPEGFIWFYYYIFKMIAWYGITVLEVISTTNEFSIVVEQKNINDAFSVLMKIKMDEEGI